MSTGIISWAFDPVLRLSETSSVRYETIGLAIVIFVALLLAAWIASRAPRDSLHDSSPGLRLDDLVFIAVGAVPGAIAGGRLGYVLGHLDYYRANPAAILDPAQGGLTLSLAVPFGILTGGLIGRLLGAPVGLWLHAAALPLLFALSAGKLVGILGATGQGSLTDLPWATSYHGPGPWGSLSAGEPAHPSQAYEAIAVAVGVAVLGIAARLGLFARRDGAAMLVAVGLWAAARIIVATTWRDPVSVGPLRVEQALALVVLTVSALGVAWRWRAAGRVRDARLGVETRPA